MLLLKLPDSKMKDIDNLKEKLEDFNEKTKAQEELQRNLAKLGNAIFEELDSILSEDISELNAKLPKGCQLHPIYSWTEEGKPYVGVCLTNSRKYGETDQNIVDSAKIDIEKRFKELEKEYDIKIGWR
jgi:hypothetical protein